MGYIDCVVLLSDCENSLRVLVKAGSYVLQALRVTVFLAQWSLAFLADPDFSLDSLNCVILAPSGYLHSSQFQSSPWGPTPEAWASAASLYLLQRACKPLLGWEVLLGIDPCGEFSPLYHLITCCCLPLWNSEAPLWGSEAPPDPAHDLRLLPPWGTGPCLEMLCLFLRSFSSALPHFEETGLPFWKSGVFWQCSEDVLKELFHSLDGFLMYLLSGWGRWSPCLIPLLSWRSFPLYNFL